MYKSAFNKLFWGFLFIMVNFKIQGFDILPNIVGYILFVMGLGQLASRSEHFRKAELFSIPMVILSILSIYERPVQAGGVQVSSGWPFGIILSAASIVLLLLLVYNLLMGIKDMADEQGKRDISEESGRRWNQFLMLEVAVLFAFIIAFVPMLGFIYIIAILIASIVLAVVLMGFMSRCGDSLL
jgi:hypothetical protein